MIHQLSALLVPKLDMAGTAVCDVRRARGRTRTSNALTLVSSLSSPLGRYCLETWHGRHHLFPLGNIVVNRLGYGAMQLAGPGVFGPAQGSQCGARRVARGRGEYDRFWHKADHPGCPRIGRDRT
jgi:hypothetical protein